MQRPTSVTVFGILNIVFAALGIVGVVATVALFAMMGTDNPAFQNNPTMDAIRNNPPYAAWLKISIILGVVASGALLAAGIGLLMLKPWARILSIIYSIYGIVMIIISTALNYVFLVQPMLQKAHEAQGPEAVGSAVGGMCGGCLGIIYPILLLIFMMRANVVAAFNQQSSGGLQPPGNFQ